MGNYTHHTVSILGRIGQLISDGDASDFFLYDCNTALLSQIDQVLGNALLSESSSESALFNVASALTAFEVKVGAAHLAAAQNVEPVKTLALGVESGCSLACTYCYNDSHYERPALGPSRSGMSLETALRSIELALTDLPEGERLTVQLIGGEPLLQFPMIRELIPRAESLGNDVGCEVRFGMNTNGLALTEETIEFLTQHRVGVAISIDGTARQHDRHRVFKNGAGSYKSLESRITKFLPLYGQYSKIKTCRITAAETDFDFLEAVDHVVQLGFNNIGLGLALGAMLAGKQHEQKEHLINTLIAQFTALKEWCLQKYNIGELFRVSIFNDTMYTLYAYRPKYVPCGAQRRYVGVSPNGDVVPCHRYIGTKEPSRISGNVNDTETNVLDVKERGRHAPAMGFLTVLDDTRDDTYACHSCWARHMCGGECYEVRETLGISFDENKRYMCDLKRALFRLGIEMFLDLRKNKRLFTQLMEMNASLKPNARRAASNL